MAATIGGPTIESSTTTPRRFGHDDKQSPHVRFQDVRFQDAERSSDADDVESGFDDTGPEPTGADFQRAASVSVEYVVPEPGTVQFNAEQSLDDSGASESSDGETTSPNNSDEDKNTDAKCQSQLDSACQSN